MLTEPGFDFGLQRRKGSLLP